MIILKTILKLSLQVTELLNELQMVDNCDKISCFHEQKRNIRSNISKVSVGEETSC